MLLRLVELTVLDLPIMGINVADKPLFRLMP